MDNDLISKRILFITTPFFEYPEKIKEAIEKLWGIVDRRYIFTKTFFTTIILNISKTLHKKLRTVEEKKLLADIIKKNYDYILIQHVYLLSHDFVKTLKSNFPHAIFLNYNWDSIKVSEYTEYIKYFDRVLSFDREDVKNHRNILYLPLFYTDDFISNSPANDSSTEFDVVFIGVLGNSSKRYEFLEHLILECDKLNLKLYVYLYSSKNYFIKCLLNGKYYKNLRHKKLSLKDIAEIYKKTKTVIDYSNPDQTGLTMRTFEALGSGRKLITTNKNIMSEPFYDPKFIDVIDPSVFKLNKDFINDFNYSNDGLISKYSISNWVQAVFIQNRS